MSQVTTTTCDLCGAVEPSPRPPATVLHKDERFKKLIISLTTNIPENGETLHACPACVSDLVQWIADRRAVRPNHPDCSASLCTRCHERLALGYQGKDGHWTPFCGECLNDTIVPMGGLDA